MTMQLTFKYKSSTLDMMASGCEVNGYAPNVAADLSGPVTEQFEVEITGARADRLAKLQQINTWLGELSQQDHVPGHNGVYQTYAVDETATAYRARVLDGVALLDSKLARRWKNNVLRAAITLRRDPAWESETWAEIPLTNSNGAGVTAGLRVFACPDLVGAAPNKHNIHVDIAAADVLGDVPGPAKIRLTPETANLPSHLFVGLYNADDTVSAAHGMMWEMEDWTGGANNADAACSAGDYKSMTIPTSWGSMAYGTIALSTSFPRCTYFRFFLRLRTAAPAGSWLKLQLLVEGQVMSITTPVLAGSSRLLDMGILRLPPYLFSGTLPLPGVLHLYGYNPAGGTLEGDVLMAVGTDGWAQRSRSAVLTSDGGARQMVEQFGTDEGSYVSIPVGSSIPYFTGVSGKGIFLYPGTAQRLSFLTRFVNDTAITDSMLVEVWHRPRRLSL